MYSYILVQPDAGEQYLQEVLNGYVVRCTDLDGNTVTPPTGGSHVVDAAYPTPAWSEVPPPPPAEEIVPPDAISKFQGKAALLQFGYLDAIEAFMASGAATPLQKLAWTEVQEFRFGSPMVREIAAMLNIDDAGLRQMFAYGASIEV